LDKAFARNQDQKRPRAGLFRMIGAAAQGGLELGSEH
jgi:hypothetical protein